MPTGWKQVLLSGDAAVLESVSNPVNVDFLAASPGTGSTASKYDHKHSVPVAVAGQIVTTDGGAASVGSLNSFVRADHKHPLGPLVASLNYQLNEATYMALQGNASVYNYAMPNKKGSIYMDLTDGHPYIYTG